MSDLFTVGSYQFNSRLLVGTGKYANADIARDAIDASGAEVVTVALRRALLDDPKQIPIQQFIDPKRYTYLPNTAGCLTADETIRTLRLAREINGWNLVKLEVIDGTPLLLPNMPETIKAAELLVNDGFEVMVYCSDDAEQAKQLEALGCVALMPIAAPIGSGLGIQHPDKIRTIVEQSSIPVLVDAGIGTASDAAIAMELGCDAVLLNTAIAGAQDPITMARAMKWGVEAGRAAYLSGRIAKRTYAVPSSPTDGIIGEAAC